MYKHIFTAVSFFLLIPLAAMSLSLAQPAPAAERQPAASQTTVSQTEESSLSDQEAGVRKARLGQLLKLNRAFDNCISDHRALIEEASIVLLDQAVETADGSMIINQRSVLDFIKDLYGVEADPAAATYEYLPAPEGYFAIPAKGYDTYSHEIENLTELDNGNVTVLSKMTVDSHDGETYTMRVVTLFQPAPDSPFGYHILRADIIQ